MFDIKIDVRRIYCMFIEKENFVLEYSSESEFVVIFEERNNRFWIFQLSM